MWSVGNLLTGIITIPIFIPFVAFIVIYLVLKRNKKSKKEAIRTAINVTTVFLLASFVIFYDLIRDKDTSLACWMILLFFLISGGGIGFIQYKIKGQLNFPRLMRAVWRLAFVFFSVAYIILFFSGVAHFMQ